MVMVTAYMAFPPLVRQHRNPVDSVTYEVEVTENQSALVPGRSVPKVPILAVAVVALTAGLGALLNISVASDMRVLRWYQNKKLERSTTKHEGLCIHSGSDPCVDPCLAPYEALGSKKIAGH
jgi:hypothetical protein